MEGLFQEVSSSVAERDGRNRYEKRASYGRGGGGEMGGVLGRHPRMHATLQVLKNIFKFRDEFSTSWVSVYGEFSSTHQILALMDFCR